MTRPTPRPMGRGALLSVLSLLFTAALPAQEPETPQPKPVRETPESEKPEPEKPAERRRIEREVAERRREIREGRVVQSHVRVTVWLTNGNRLLGVVKNGRFVEKHNGSRFVEANPNEPAVGIRLWYSNQTNSYIFLPFDSIARYRIGERLTEEEVRDLGEALQKAADERAEKAREQAEARRRSREGAEEGEGGKEGAEGGPAPAPSAETTVKLTTEEAALLKEFPPSKGWGQQKVDELQRRQVVIGVFPNAIERKFLDNFETWKVAAAKQEAIDKAKAGGTGGSGETPTPTPGTGGAETPTEESGRRRGRTPRSRGGRSGGGTEETPAGSGDGRR